MKGAEGSPKITEYTNLSRTIEQHRAVVPRRRPHETGLDDKELLQLKQKGDI